MGLWEALFFSFLFVLGGCEGGGEGRGGANVRLCVGVFKAEAATSPPRLEKAR